MNGSPLTLDDLEKVRFQETGDGPALVPVITQDATTGSVLMLAWADRGALETSLKSGSMHYWSRSRKSLWRKGETSGHVQSLHGLYLDCDQDAVLALVDQAGPACHTGASTCWHEADEDAGMPVSGILGVLAGLLAERKATPKEGSYTNRLLSDENLRLKKVQEEAGEFLVAAAKGDVEQMRYEAADVLYHLLVALEAEGIGLGSVLHELNRRRK